MWPEAGRLNRINTMWNQQMGLGGQLSGIAGQSYDQMFAADGQLLNAGLGMEMGMADEGYNQSQKNAEGLKGESSCRTRCPIRRLLVCFVVSLR